MVVQADGVGVELRSAAFAQEVDYSADGEGVRKLLLAGKDHPQDDFYIDLALCTLGEIPDASSKHIDIELCIGLTELVANGAVFTQGTETVGWVKKMTINGAYNPIPAGEDLAVQIDADSDTATKGMATVLVFGHYV